MSAEGFPLSPQQRRLWSSHRVADTGPGGSAAHVVLQGALEVGRLAQALERVVEKHELLRTTFPAAGEPRQVVSNGTVPLRVLSAVGDDERAERSDELFRELCTGAFELERGPLLAACVLPGEGTRHDLFLALPCLCADRASLALLVADLAAAYESLSGGGAFEQDALQYADVAQWQTELLEADESEPGRALWRARAQAPQDPGAELELPFQGTSPLSQPPAVLARRLDPELTAGVARLATRRGVKERDVLLAAWSALLSRLGGETDPRLGLTADGRGYEELADALGPLARTLPLDVHVDPQAGFDALVDAVARDASESEKWQECFEPELHGDRPPRFAFEHVAAPAAVQGGGVGFRIERELAPTEPAACRLVCRSLAEEGACETVLEFDPGAFRPETIERMAEAFEALLAHAVAHPGERVAALDALGAGERQRLLVDFNDTDADYPRDVCIHAFIEEHAARTPDAVAVRQGDDSLTYGELDRRANRLAHHLIERGVGPDSLVALCIERSPEMVVAILAILKAGGAYVPVDPAYPQDRLSFLLEDTRAPVLLTQASMLERLPETGAALVVVDRDAQEIARHPEHPPQSGVTPGNLVYVIYTSGSTGKPKGVVITHEKLVISNTARVNAFGHTPGTFLLLSSVAFDSSVVGIFWTLCGGGTLLLVPEGEQKDIGELPKAIAAGGVTHLLTLPSFYRLILEQSRPEDLASLRTVIVAGEACPKKMVDHHRELLPGVALASEYGATETTVFSSVFDCLGQELPIAALGTPIDNAQMYVLDADLGPCPTGVPGEVHFGGIAIALGYWRRPELTAERFVPDPFRPEVPGARLYKSGDLARVLEDGQMEFLGRLDNQVKIRGFRVELEEIEVALLKHPAVKESAVLALTDLSDDKRLVGYLVPEGGERPAVAELREFLAETLPDFMVPAVFVVLDDFPRTPNGKVDRKALPAPGAERPELEGDYEAASTPAEEALAGVWAEVLGLERVGVNDNFFELGGDSILSIQIVSRAKKAGVKVTPRQLFENQTVAELAPVAVLEDGGSPAEVADQGLVTGSAPLVPIQRWFFGLDLPRPDHWNMPVLLEVLRPLRLEHLEAAVAALVRHHDALRARFRRADDLRSRFRRAEDLWVQEIVAAEEHALVVREDLGAVSEAELEAVLAARAGEHHGALDLARGPLLRCVLFERSTGPSLVLFIVHHLVVDGVSWRILVEDLAQALDQLERGEPVRSPAKTTSFQTWGRKLEVYAHAPEREADLEPWRALAGTPVTALPLDRDGENLESSARSVTAGLDAERTRALLAEVPKTYNTRIDDVLLTALVHVVAQWTGQGSVLLTLEGHGREDVFEGVDLSRTVGWFTTDYPALLTDTAPFEPGEALRSIKEQLRAIPDGGLGFGLGRYMGDDATVQALTALPQPELGFNYLGQFDQALRDEDRFRFCTAAPGASQAPGGRRVFPLEVWGQVAGGRLELFFEYSENLHERSTIERLAGEFTAALEQLIEHCRAPQSGGFTKSDFADFAWGAEDLQGIADAIQRTREGDAG